MKYGFVFNQDNEIVATFHGEGENYHMAVHAFMMAGYSVMHVTEEEYLLEKEKEQWKQ